MLPVEKTDDEQFYNKNLPFGPCTPIMTIGNNSSTTDLSDSSRSATYVPNLPVPAINTQYPYMHLKSTPSSNMFNGSTTLPQYWYSDFGSYSVAPCSIDLSLVNKAQPVNLSSYDSGINWTENTAVYTCLGQSSCNTGNWTWNDMPNNWKCNNSSSYCTHQNCPSNDSRHAMPHKYLPVSCCAGYKCCNNNSSVEQNCNQVAFFPNKKIPTSALKETRGRRKKQCNNTNSVPSSSLHDVEVDDSEQQARTPGSQMPTNSQNKNDVTNKPDKELVVSLPGGSLLFSVPLASSRADVPTKTRTVRYKTSSPKPRKKAAPRKPRNEVIRHVFPRSLTLTRPVITRSVSVQTSEDLFPKSIPKEHGSIPLSHSAEEKDANFSGASSRPSLQQQGLKNQMNSNAYINANDPSGDKEDKNSQSGHSMPVDSQYRQCVGTSKNTKSTKTPTNQNDQKVKNVPSRNVLPAVGVKESSLSTTKLKLAPQQAKSTKSVFETRRDRCARFGNGGDNFNNETLDKGTFFDMPNIFGILEKPNMVKTCDAGRQNTVETIIEIDEQNTDAVLNETNGQNAVKAINDKKRQETLSDDEEMEINKATSVSDKRKLHSFLNPITAESESTTITHRNGIAAEGKRSQPYSYFPSFLSIDSDSDLDSEHDDCIPSKPQSGVHKTTNIQQQSDSFNSASLDGVINRIAKLPLARDHDRRHSLLASNGEKETGEFVPTLHSGSPIDLSYPPSSANKEAVTVQETHSSTNEIRTSCRTKPKPPPAKPAQPLKVLTRVPTQATFVGNIEENSVHEYLEEKSYSGVEKNIAVPRYPLNKVTLHPQLQKYCLPVSSSLTPKENFRSGNSISSISSSVLRLPSNNAETSNDVRLNTPHVIRHTKSPTIVQNWNKNKETRLNQTCSMNASIRDPVNVKQQTEYNEMKNWTMKREIQRAETTREMAPSCLHRTDFQGTASSKRSRTNSMMKTLLQYNKPNNNCQTGTNKTKTKLNGDLNKVFVLGNSSPRIQLPSRGKFKEVLLEIPGPMERRTRVRMPVRRNKANVTQTPNGGDRSDTEHCNKVMPKLETREKTPRCEKPIIGKEMLHKQNAKRSRKVVPPEISRSLGSRTAMVGMGNSLSMNRNFGRQTKNAFVPINKDFKDVGAKKKEHNLVAKMPALYESDGCESISSGSSLSSFQAPATTKADDSATKRNIVLSNIEDDEDDDDILDLHPERDSFLDMF